MNGSRAGPLAGVSLRRIEVSDFEFLYQVYAASRDREMELVPQWRAADKEAFLRDQFRLQHTHYQAHYPGARFDLICTHETPIGRLYVAPMEDELRLMDIALLPQWRERGIGSALIRELMSEARASEKWVSLHVEPDNPARRLYGRLGFVDMAHIGLYVQMRWDARGDRPDTSACGLNQVKTAS